MKHRGFLPSILRLVGLRQPLDDSSEEDEEAAPEETENLDLADGAAWARSYRESFEVASNYRWLLDAFSFCVPQPE